MIHHVTIRVSELDRAKRFYAAALAPLGYRVLADLDTFVGLGAEGGPDLWLARYDERTPQHVAFAAPDQGSVEDFYRSALAAGGVDNGPPGPRPMYSPQYWGAFVLDHDGNNIEAVVMVRPRGEAKAPPAKKQPAAKKQQKAAPAKQQKAAPGKQQKAAPGKQQKAAPAKQQKATPAKKKAAPARAKPGRRR